MLDPKLRTCTIDLTYYLARSSEKSASEIETAVNAAVKQYKQWQCSKLGRDINPSMLISLLMAAGVKRVTVRAPTYTVLSDGSDHVRPQIASFSSSTTVVNGGYEDD